MDDEAPPIAASNVEAEMAAFHAAAKRRNVRILAIAGLACLLIGAVVLVVAFTAGDSIDSNVYSVVRTERKFEIRTIAAGIGFVIAGGGLLIKAWDVKRGLAA